jgi:hypothetical protein
MIKLILVPVFLMMSMIAPAQVNKGFSFVERKDKKQIDVLFDGKLMTAYCYYDSSRKPVLFPVNTVDGITVTRSYPFTMVSGERTDHPHHTGIWLNYESVNGLDFWNNSTAIAPEKRGRYGSIIHQFVIGKKLYGDNAVINTQAAWVRPDNKTLLKEETLYSFTVKQKDFVIDRITRLTATDTNVLFKDVKDGLFAIRVARELELPSKEKSSFVDDKGNVTAIPPSGNDVTGMYYSNGGLKGDSVWSSKGTWVMLTGRKDGKDITIAMFDHPLNVGYPAYWHARGYGLFSINPLGRKVFSNGKEELNFTLQRGQTVTFRYRIVVHSGVPFTNEEMNKYSADFEKIR